MAVDTTLLAARISALIDDSASVSSESLLAEMEHTLTDGYARVLELEGERWRIERRISDLAREIETNETGELRLLAQRLLTADDEAGRLRGLLERLRRRTEAVRAATAAAFETA
jgi:hypothetical protein